MGTTSLDCDPAHRLLGRNYLRIAAWLAIVAATAFTSWAVFPGHSTSGLAATCTSGFSSTSSITSRDSRIRYDVTRLLYWESYDDVHRALARETQLKGWSRAKKIALIVRRNPHWMDLAREWYPWMKCAEGRDASTAQ